VLSLVLLSTVAVSIPAVMVLGEGITKDETTPPRGGGVPFEDSLQTIINGLDWVFSSMENWFSESNYA